ncbi:nucleotidyltransferase domain-containing protein [Saccharospirillum mangrovi]|uniref:nucleotidyltransferase domain-containing protein n=1 Tax=Saccharospirillum mangrovi TaxID=2161747 RepID=UPI000D392628|nr:nucleotidyltransferase domain-containing protein [Saccharospirillum mangrovi]
MTEASTHLLRHLPHQKAIVDAFLAAFEPEADVVAAVLLGSLAGGTGDRLSDADLMVFTQNNFHRQSDAAYQRFEQNFEVLYRLEGDHNERARYKKYLFGDGTSAEIHCADLSEPFDIARPFLVLFDKANIVADRLTDEPAPAHETFPVYEQGDAGLIWELLSCIKWLRRGQTGMAKQYLKRLASAL